MKWTTTFSEKSQLGACKITEFMGKFNTSRHILQENMLRFRKHNWQEFYLTAGRGGCGKFQLCVTSAGLPTARHSGRLLNFASKISHYCRRGRDSGVDHGWQHITIARCQPLPKQNLVCKVLTRSVNTLVIQGSETGCQHLNFTRCDTNQSNTSFGRCQHLPKQYLLW